MRSRQCTGRIKELIKLPADKRQAVMILAQGRKLTCGDVPVKSYGERRPMLVSRVNRWPAARGKHGRGDGGKRGQRSIYILSSENTCDF